MNRAENINEGMILTEREEHSMRVSVPVFETRRLHWNRDAQIFEHGDVVDSRVDDYGERYYTCSCGWEGYSYDDAREHLIDVGIIDNLGAERSENIDGDNDE